MLRVAWRKQISHTHDAGLLLLRGGCDRHVRGRGQRKHNGGATKRGVAREADARASSCLTVRCLGHGGGDGVHDKHTMAWSHEGDAVVLEALGVRPSRERVAGVLHSGDKRAGGRVNPAERGESNGVEHIAASEDSGEIAGLVGGREARAGAADSDGVAGAAGEIEFDLSY